MNWQALDQTMSGLSSTLMQLGMMKQMGILPSKPKSKGTPDDGTAEQPMPETPPADTGTSTGGSPSDLIRQYIGQGMPDGATRSMMPQAGQMPFFGPGSSNPGGLTPQELMQQIMQQQLMKQFGRAGMGGGMGGQGIIQPQNPNAPVMY